MAGGDQICVLAMLRGVAWHGPQASCYTHSESQLWPAPGGGEIRLTVAGGPSELLLKALDTQ